MSNSDRRATIGDGRVVAVYADKWLPLLQALGTPEIHRATDIEFDNETQEWVAVERKTNTEIARGENRAELIETEISYLEKDLLCRTP